MNNSIMIPPERLSAALAYNHTGCTCACGSGASSTPEEPFTLQPLAFAVDALEPYIDAQTVTIHHDKHHAAYVANLNKALKGQSGLANQKVCSILKNLKSVPPEILTAVRNQGGGVFNHNFYWKILGPDNRGAKPIGELAQAIEKTFGTFAQFQEKMTQAAVGQFGSGWAWLTLSQEGSLQIEATSNQDCPLSEGRLPLLTIDVWEHAYYLKYQNRRPDYAKAIWNLFNWDFISSRYAKLIKEL